MEHPESRYDAHAHWYDDWVADPEEDLVVSSLLRLAGPQPGQRVLDLACGQGRVARHLLRRGCVVVGVDRSAELLAIAKDADDSDATYMHADVCSTAWWDGRLFDGVLASMALMDIDDLRGAVATAAAVVRSGGWFAWSIIHPAFPGVGAIRPSWPRDLSYFDERWWNTGGAGVRGRVGSNHRTLSTYMNASLESGFVLERTEEPPWESPAGVAMPFFFVSVWRRM